MLVDADSNPTLFILHCLTESGMKPEDAFRTMMRFHKLSRAEVARAFKFPDEATVTPLVVSR